MKKRIALGAGLLLTLGTAVAGTIFYGQSDYHSGELAPAVAPTTSPAPTVEMIAMWKATAASTDYMAPKAPI
jgi:hypothetical protein